MSDSPPVSTPVLALLGLGAMGRPMAECVIRAGHRPVLFDTRNKALAPFEGRADLAGSPAEAASRADLVLGCLPTLAAYEAAVLGPDGVAAGDRARVYIHVGTTGAAMVERFAAALAPRGMAVLDAPMTGGPARARSGSLTVMVSGPRAALAAAEPFLRCYAGKIVDFGERPGAAQAMKLVNNVMSGTNLMIACEALVLGTKAGLDPAKMLEVINSGTGRNHATGNEVPFHILPRSFDFGAHLAILVKDLKAAMEEAERLAVPMPIAAAVCRGFAAAMAEGAETDDITTVIRSLERAARIELPRVELPRVVDPHAT